MAAERHAPREPGTRALLDALAAGDPDQVLSLRELLAGLDRRSFRFRSVARSAGRW